MLRAIRRLHTWAGLLTFVHLTVYGIAGLSALCGVGLRGPVPTARSWDRPFTAAANATDKQVAEAVCRELGLTLALPVQSAAIQRDASHLLVLDLWHVNGHHRVTVLEREHRIHVEQFRVGLPRYLDVLHMTTAALRSDDWRMTAWARSNEVALWCLIGMMISGTWLWLAKLSRLTLGAGTKTRTIHRYAGLFLLVPLAIYAVSAVQLAHRSWLPAAREVTKQTAIVSPPDGGRDIARQLMDRGFIHGEIRGVFHSGDVVRISAGSPGISYSVACRADSCEVQQTRTGFIGALTDLHRMTSPRWWSTVLVAVSLGLVLLGVTGIWMSLRNSRERRANTVLLVAASSWVLYLLISMRL